MALEQAVSVTSKTDTKVTEWAYVNGEFMPLAQATVPVLDRGFLFGDAIYEVIVAHHGKIRRLNYHLQRLTKNLSAIRLNYCVTSFPWDSVLNKLITLSKQPHQYIYLQITRGVASNRKHSFPTEAIKPTVVLFTQTFQPPAKDILSQGITAITLKDIRWAYPHIKATSLLANVLLQQAGVDNNVDEVILLKDGYVTEATSCNTFIVVNNTIITPPATPDILPGVTRSILLEIAERQQLPYQEKPIIEQELRQADELWISNSTRGPHPVTQLDNKLIGTGKVGPVWHNIYDHYQQELS